MGKVLTLVLLGGLALAPISRAAEPGHVTGIGGIFVKSKDPKALAAWYRDVLGVELEPWGGAVLKYDAPGHPPVSVWNAFPGSTDYFAPSSQPFMIDLSVDDLDAMAERLKRHGVAILKRDDNEPNGRFAWILDPDGVKIELWEPKRK
ncbi:VOC family protein [Phenylobacterium montanum]|uniref:VOC family protein n=1 Tax=Phenylobacterium montanum TaxID=2823693 RepID=A0A975IV98_9CAUL|nr:VOC family protein [Caulobacter sp. S6]QUD88560.1 VOC family protein [Caulobacter sp. S6]